MERNKNIDLIRLVSMMLVVSLHFFNHGCFLNVGGDNFYFVSVMNTLSKVSVDCFFMITGFFLIGKDVIDISKTKQKVLSCWKQMLFYSVFVYIVLLGVGLIDFDYLTAIKTLFPISTNAYWFICIYIFLLCLLPFVSVLLKHIGYKDVIFMTALYFVYDAVWPSIGFTFWPSKGNSVSHALLMVLIGYIVKCEMNKRLKGSASIYMLSYIVLCGAGALFTLFLKQSFITIDSPFIVLASTCFFVAMNKVKINAQIGRLLSFISPNVLAVYLIHENPAMYDVLWLKILHCDYFYSSSYLPVFYIVCIVSITTVCIIADMLIDRILRKSNLIWLKK